MKIKKVSKFKKDIFFSYLTQGIVMIFGFVNIFLITNYTGIDKYGQYAILVSSVGFMSLLLTARSGEAIVRFYKSSKIKNNYIDAKTYIFYGFIIDIITSILLYSLVVIFSDFIASSLLKDQTLTSIVVLFGVINIFVFLKGTIEGYLQANEMFYFFNGMKIFQILLLSISLFISFIFFGKELINIVYSYIFVYSLSFIITLTIFLIYFHKEFKKIKIKINKSTFLEYIKFNSITFSSSAMKAGNQNFDSLILSYFTNPALVGIYTILKKFFMPINVAVKPFQTIMYPKLTQLWHEKNYKIFHESIIKTTKLLLFVAFMYFIILIIFSDYLISFFNLDYANIYTVLYSFIIYFALVPLIWWSRNFSNIINPMFSLISTSLNTILQLTLCTLLTYLYGIEGLIIGLISIKIIIVIYWVIRYKNTMVGLTK